MKKTKETENELNKNYQSKEKITEAFSEMEQLELLAEIIADIYLKLRNGKTK